jgi:chromosome segregation ATPase
MDALGFHGGNAQMTSLEPSVEAIEAVRQVLHLARSAWSIKDALKAAYTIDFAELQKELENVTKERNNFWKFYTDTQQRLEDVNVKDAAKTREINLLVDENRNLQQQLSASQAECESGNREIERLHIALRNYQQALPDLSIERDLVVAERDSLQTENAKLLADAEAFCRVIDSLRQDLKEADGLLEKMIVTADTANSKSSYCLFCGFYNKEHGPTCRVTLTRAYLARRKESE